MSDLSTRQKKNSHEPLQGAKLDALDPLSQAGDLLLDAGLGLLNLQLLHVGLLPDAALFEVQVQADACLGAADLVTEAGVELGQVVGQALVGGTGEEGFGGVGGEELGPELGEVDFLGVGGAFGVFLKKGGGVR